MPGSGLVPPLIEPIARTMAGTLIDYNEPVPKQEGNRYQPQGKDGHVEGRHKGRHWSSCTAVRTHPTISSGVVAAAAVAGVGALLLSQRDARLTSAPPPAQPVVEGQCPTLEGPAPPPCWRMVPFPICDGEDFPGRCR